MTNDDDWAAFLHEHGIDASASPEGKPRRAAGQSSTIAARRRHVSGIVWFVAVAASAAGVLWWMLAGDTSLSGSDVLMPDVSSTDQPYEDSELDPMFNREVGDCFMWAEEVASGRMRTCDELHDAEVASTFQYPGNRMPSADSDYMQKRCTRAVNQYLGPDRADLAPWRISWSIPMIPLWDQGYRDSSCIVVFEEVVDRSTQNADR